MEPGGGGRVMWWERFSAAEPWRFVELEGQMKAADYKEVPEEMWSTREQ